MAGAFFNMEIEIFMVKISYQQKPYRRNLMETFGATVHASPTNLTDAGRSILALDSENMEAWALRSAKRWKLLPRVVVRLSILLEACLIMC